MKKDFEVKVQERPTAKIKTWLIGTKNADTARAHAEHVLKLRGAKEGKVLSVREVVK